MIIRKIANYAGCLVEIILMNILRFILTEKMVVFTEKQLLKNGIRRQKKMKEELFKKNFPQFVTEKGMCLSPFFDLFSAGIECATEELEKENAELEKENAELEKENAELEKENAELNKQVARMLNDAFNIYQNDNDRLRKENTELKDDNRVMADNYSKMEQEFYCNIARAIEIIKNIIRVTWGEGWNYSLDWKVKAEQFLNSEVVK